MADWTQTDRKFYRSELAVLGNRFTNLDYRFKSNKDGSRRLVARGKYEIRAKYEHELIEDIYELKLEFPKDYPDEMPIVIEEGGKIGFGADNHNSPEFGLCLETSLSLDKLLNDTRNLSTFFELVLDHNLYWHSYRSKHGKEPFPARPHYERGLTDQLIQEYGFPEDHGLISALLACARDYDGSLACPCGSGCSLENCCSKCVLKLKSQHSPAVIKDVSNQLQSHPSTFINKSISVDEICERYVKGLFRRIDILQKCL